MEQGDNEATTSGRSLVSHPGQVPWTSKLTWLFKSKASIDGEAEAHYHAALQAAAAEDWSDMDELGFIKTSPELRDRAGRPLLLVSAASFPAKVMRHDRVYRYLVHKLDPVVREGEAAGGYSIVWLQTCARYWEHCPGVTWLWHVYERLLPRRVRDGLHAVHVVHCDLALWAGSLGLMPWLTGGVWSRVRWVARLEFLWEEVEQAALAPLLPEAVVAHDAELEDAPLADYGLIAPHHDIQGLAAMAASGPVPLGAINSAPPM